MGILLQGKVWKFGDDINTDYLSPSFIKDMPWDEAKTHILHIRPDFGAGFQAGDVIVAGANFGCGSSRQSAPENLKRLGVGCVVAESFARIFFRNCFAVALPVLACPGIGAGFEDGDELKFDFDRSRVENLTQGTEFSGPPLPPELVRIVAAGGVMEMLKLKNRAGEGDGKNV